MFSKFLKQGLCVIPLRKGIPQVEWSRFYDTLPSEDDAQGWDEAGHKEYALLCGGVSNIIALDIDTNDTALFYTLAGHTPLRKVGSKGFTAFYRYNGERSQTWGGMCELLSDKRLTTIPPSPHRKTGIPYVWMDSDEINPQTLPTINPDFFTFMDAKYPKASTRAWVPPVEYNESVDLSTAAEMLDYISSDCSRDDWIQIGMALRDEFGDAACALWHNWSGKASMRYNHNDAQAAWRSFGGQGVTIGTLVYLAKQGGWLPQQRESHDAFSVDISYIFSPKRAQATAPEAQIKVSGLVGEIADWITSTAIRPQPVLSLAAAITFCGMMKGHRVRGHTNLRTNILTLSLAPTSAGKEHPQQCIDRLAEACGLGRHLMGRPTSGTGLLTGIAKASSVALMSIDEMGRYMGNIANKNSGGFQREITDYMVELFSAAGRTFRGRQYANEKINPQVILQQPHLCCLGSTVPERMQAACTGAEIVDGFLNRWLIFSAEGRPTKQKGVKFSPPPTALVDKITYWLAEHPIERDNYGTPNPAEIRFTPEAWEVHEAFDLEMISNLDSKPYPVNLLYARAAEHAEKLAMIICDDMVVGVEEIQAAIKITKQSCLQLEVFAANITDSQHESDVVYLFEVIKKWPNISRNQLTHRTRKLNQRQRNEILSQLIDAGDIVVSGEGKKVTFSANV